MLMAVSSLYIGGRIVASMLEKDIIIRSITLTNSKICGLISDYFNNSSEIIIKTSLERLDICHKLEVIESYISNIPHNDDDDKTNKTELISLHGIEEMIKKIHDELDYIKNMAESHKQKYFYWMRAFDITTDLANLECHVKNLDNRFNLFMKIRHTNK